MKEIVDLLFSKQDIKFRDFQAPLFPTIDKERIIGVRTPDIKQLAKELYGIKDYQECLNEFNKFLPYIDNWATCDTLDPKVFAKHKEELLLEIKRWLKSKHTYTVRFAIGMLLGYYLDESFNEEYLKWVSSIKSEEYYINMMIAWYFATALAKQYPSTIKYIEENKLSPWVHNKTIQKAVESYRVSDEQKTYLKSLKIAKN